MPSQNQQQPSRQQGTYQSIRQQTSSPAPVRHQEHVAEFSAEPLMPEDRLTSSQWTVYDPDTGATTTTTVKPHFLLACGCKASSPADVAGACVSCGRLSRSFRWKTNKPLPLVCRRHSMCLRCRRKRLRELHGGGPIKKTLRFLLKVILWPLFDVEESADVSQTQAEGRLGRVPRPRPGSSVSPRTRTPRR